uniref:Acyltransferase n=1 Tax=Ditylum brightwellii TaxID=49249 RepID=A0A7S1ZEZ1_9STRA|mmetsp:Transcript_302/g.466  ORF Transcript_302/g.466 Transcript_302/m.466 type:complete len:393 (+) Transcript_302:156-1334(+)
MCAPTEPNATTAATTTTSSPNSTTTTAQENDKQEYYCLDVWAIPPEMYTLTNEERKKTLPTVHRHHKGPFPPNSLTTPSPITLSEEVTAIIMLLIIIGGPLLWIWSTIAALLFGSWKIRTAAVLISTILAYHPLPSSPEFSEKAMASTYTQCLYKYFSYRFVWKNDALQKVQNAEPFLAAGPPHGVLPIANLLSIPGTNVLGCMKFVGAPASIVFRTPFLRYMTLYPSIHVDRASIIKNIVENGTSTGLVPDGIAGIFKQSDHAEVVALKHRKGMARLALSTGTPIIPAYSFNNTAAFSAWWDPYGILENISRKMQASLFLYWGRFGCCPIPRRVQITMVYGEPIRVDKVEGGNPTVEQVDELHERILDGIRDCFESHKHALGLGEKELIFE